MLNTYLPIIICFLAGIGLIIAEVFLPGFGLPGISGIILSIVSIVIAWNAYGSLAGLGMTAVVIAVIGSAVVFMLRSASKGRLSKSGFILKEAETVENGYRAAEIGAAVPGMEGIASTVLRPTGIAVFGEERLNVMTDGDFINPGTPVVITATEGAKIVVKRVETNA